MYSKLLCTKCNNLASFCTLQNGPSSFISALKHSSILFNQQFKTNSFSQISNKQNSDLIAKRNLFNLPIIQSFVRTSIKGGPGYTKFGHGRYKMNVSRYAYFWYAFLFGSLSLALFFNPENWSICGNEPYEKLKEMRNFFSRDTVPKAKEIADVDKSKAGEINSGEEEDDNKSVESDEKSKKNKATFRQRKIIQYENRIRQYSTPDKIFRYFATIQILNEKNNEFEVFMTPSDFLRSITYGAMQPEGLGLDTYNRYDPKMFKLDLNLSEHSVFRRLSPKGLISFSDYLFLVTMLSTPTKHFEIAFRMFDLDGNGNLDIGEFEQLQTIIRNQTSSGQRHRDTRMTGSVLKGNSTLNEYFFGPDCDQLLTVKKFTDFQKQLQAECIQKEFEAREAITRESDGQQIISVSSFGEMLLAYAGYNSAKIKKMLKRVSKSEKYTQEGITLKEYQDFFQVLRSIYDIDTALKFYSIAGASIDQGIMKHVAKTVANVDLSDHLISVIFDLFDEDGDGKLSQREFVLVMKKKLSGGLKQPKDTGFVKLLESATSCLKENFF